MLTDAELKLKWDNLPYQDEGYLRVDPHHEIDWYIGYESINQKSMLLISKTEPPEITSSKSIAVNVGERKDGSWALVLKLISIEREEVFIRLCWDLIESSRGCSNNEVGLNFIINRYNQWAKLLENQKTSILSESQQKGLFGELHFIVEKITNEKNSMETILGWMGPEGADQDFVYFNKWHEVKTIGLSAITVGISSIEQLDVSLPGELVIYFADLTSATDQQGTTLKNKVSKVRELVQNRSDALKIFENKLLKIGYIDLPDYDKFPYKLNGMKRYNLDEKFPRLTRSSVPDEITSLKYEINIQAIAPWQCE